MKSEMLIMLSISVEISITTMIITSNHCSVRPININFDSIPIIPNWSKLTRFIQSCVSLIVMTFTSTPGLLPHGCCILTEPLRRRSLIPAFDRSWALRRIVAVPRIVIDPSGSVVVFHSIRSNVAPVRRPNFRQLSQSFQPPISRSSPWFSIHFQRYSVRFLN